MVLVIDNYDSFTFNLYQSIGSLGLVGEIVVRRNDAITVGEIGALGPDRIVISPGPCTIREGGVSMDVVRYAADRGVSLLGVCLGHQCVASLFGGRIVPAKRLMHGKTSVIGHDGRGVFSGLSSPQTVMRYHSLAVSRDGLPEDFEVSAWAEDDGEVMGIRHKGLPIEGVQFHPESFMTGEGDRMIRNFIEAG
jgi:anthranilate synthase/aminodeoxychorismate synthase-like glutamine amidotransferase